MKKERFEIAKKDIFDLFYNQPKKVFQYSDISKILNENREFWRLTKSMTAKSFLEKLIKSNKLKEHIIEFPSRKIIRYSWGEISTLKTISTIQNNAYLSHYSAMYLHELTLQIPKSIYINIEQSPKPSSKSPLLQKNIDIAFTSKQRTTNNIANFNNFKIYLLNGKNTNNLGVIEIETAEKEKVNVTNIERTLIDITVRPIYSGGVSQVLEAFKLAKEKVSINKLCAMLKKLNYVYPYHQAIGFYLEKSGVYKDSQINLLKNIDIKHNFYLTHNMKETNFSKQWKIFYPKGF